MNNVPDIRNFYLGKKTNAVKPQTDNTASTTLEEYISNDWRNKIAVSEKSSSMSVMAKEYMKKINFGTAAHKVMSYIKMPADLEPAVNKLFYAGMLNAEAKETIASQLKKIFENESLKKFFTDDWQILAGREILFPNDSSLRPDRIMIRDKHA